MKLLSLFFVLFIGFNSMANATTLEVNAIKPLNHVMNFNFGLTYVNSLRTAQFEITNSSLEMIPFEGSYVHGADFSARHSCSHGIPARGRCLVEIRYWPMFVGYHYGQVDFLFAYGNDIRFMVSGEAIH